ncbi:MAG: ABC transporter ATP-binding protein [Clostridiales Family XIII bacterium]|jgi:ABC-type nitrate/sulfonate/bicarbonate transport system ATPase subunit|nr:ABC transporter ATP-binding protein [Clostridiales Family XIII bacterium]
MANGLKIENLSKSFLTADRRPLSVLEDICLTVDNSEFVTIVGHSGCGKSTLLKIIAGLEAADSGGVSVDGRPCNAPGPDRGMIFQEHRLLPWLTIEQNVTLGLEGVPRREKAEISGHYLKLVRLDGFGKAYPSELSGGMSQRAAIARALATQPQLLLLDEPFGALDALTKIEMQKEILNIRRNSNNTMLMVTHDIEEAVYLSDRVVVMSSRPGRIKEIVKIELAESRNRGSADFAWYKQRILLHFFDEDEESRPEFSI